jgi:hypothetical protein
MSRKLTNVLFVTALIFFMIIFTAGGCPLPQYPQNSNIMEIQNDTTGVIHVQVLDFEKMPIKGASYEIQPGESEQIRALSDNYDYISISNTTGDVWHYTGGGDDLVDIIFESKVLTVNDTNGYWGN